MRRRRGGARFAAGLLARVGVVQREGDHFSVRASFTPLVSMLSLEAGLSRTVITSDALIRRLQGADGADPMLVAGLT